MKETQNRCNVTIPQAGWLVNVDFFDRWVNVLAENDNVPPVDSAFVISPEEPIEDGLLSFY